MLARYAGDELKLAGARARRAGSKKGRIDVPSSDRLRRAGRDRDRGSCPRDRRCASYSTEGDQWTDRARLASAAYVSWMDVEISDETRKVTLQQLLSRSIPTSPPTPAPIPR